MSIEIRPQAFDPHAELIQFQSQLDSGQYGAMNMFIGTMRDFNEGDNITSMFLEHYPGMTEKYLEKIAQQASTKWPIIDSLIIHRVGEIQPGEPIVLVAVWAAHRAAAFDACRDIMELLKSEAPFWKKEKLQDSQRWVEKNTPG